MLTPFPSQACNSTFLIFLSDCLEARVWSPNSLVAAAMAGGGLATRSAIMPPFTPLLPNVI